MAEYCESIEAVSNTVGDCHKQLSRLFNLWIKDNSSDLTEITHYCDIVSWQDTFTRNHHCVLTFFYEVSDYESLCDR